MIRHIVVLALRKGSDTANVKQVMGELGALVDVLPGFVAFEHGPNLDFEQKSTGYPYGFICTFADARALQTYADDRTHKALGVRLVALCKGGADGIMVIDLEVP
ncbi:MAG: Dabb family protein, partial [Pseudomonadota bacterium]